MFPLPGELPNPGMEPRSPPLRADSLLSDPSVKPKGAFLTTGPPGKSLTGVGYYALLQGIFPIHDRTWVSCTAGR